MVGTIHTDSDDECHAWPVCQTKPSATLLQHSEKAALPSQTKAINAFRAAEAARRLPEIQHTSNTDQTTPSSTGDTAPSGSTLANSATLKTGKQTRVEAVVDESDGEEYEDACTKECEDARTNPRHKFLFPSANIKTDTW
jgi:hypothetical protein